MTYSGSESRRLNLYPEIQNTFTSQAGLEIINFNKNNMNLSYFSEY